MGLYRKTENRRWEQCWRSENRDMGLWKGSENREVRGVWGAGVWGAGAGVWGAGCGREVRTGRWGSNREEVITGR